MREYNTLQWENTNGIAKITLNRPDAANSVNLEMAQELMHVAMVCDEDSSIRAVILTATGNMFCAGGDVPSFLAAGDNVGLLLKDVTACLHSANARDIVIAAEKAKFTMAYTGMGASPDGGASIYLPRLIGLRRTQELMLTNRVLSAQEALDWGLLTKVVATEELMSEAEALANKLASGPQMAHGQIKQLLLGSYSNSLETQLEIESRGIARCVSSPEGREGLLAFSEKRKPDFKSVK